MAKTILLTGCSSGIGLAAAARFATEGWNVAATARNPAVLGELAGRHPNLLPLRLDVTDGESIRKSVAMIRHVLPHMRRQKSGTIINMLSLGGRIATPFAVGYYSGFPMTRTRTRKVERSN